MAILGAILGGIVGAVAGAVVGLLLVEVIFPSDRSWPDVVPFALAILGGLGGRQVGRWRHPRPSSDH